MSYAGVDSTLGLVLDKHAEQAKQYEELVNRLRAADGDREAALKNFVESSDDPQVVKLRAGIAKLESQLKELAEKNVVSETLSEDDKAQLKETEATLKSQFRDGRKAILSIAETMKAMIDVDKVKEALEEIGDPTRGGRGRKVGDPGSSLPKASATLVLTNANGSWTHETFGTAAKFAGVSVEDLQKAYATAANVDHADIASVTTPQTFSIKGTAGQFTVATTPKARKKPGPRSGGNQGTATAAQTATATQAA